MKDLKDLKIHLDIQTHRKNPVGLFRSTYRDETGKIAHITHSRLKGQSLETLRIIQAALQGNALLKSDVKVTDSKEYGASYVCRALAKQTGLDKAIYSRPNEPWVCNCLAMIIGRLIYAGSKLSLSNCTNYSALWEVCGIPDAEIDVDRHCYEPMDKLLERQEEIQKALARKHLADGVLVLYDITSSYFEGEYAGSKLVEFGYNRDKKRGHEQIVISLLCNKDGCPVAVEVFPGNTKDETTVLDKISEIKTKYGIENIVFVGDRGMVTSAQYEKIDHGTVKVISALTHSNIRKLCDEETIQLSLFDEENIVEITDSDKNIRYCLCKNPVIGEKETNTRKTLLQKTADDLDKIVNGTRKTKLSKEVRIGKIIAKYNMAKFVVLTGSGNDVKWAFDQEKINEEQALDGCYVIYTDVDETSMTAAEIVANYKSLIKVEQAFRKLKTTRLEIRPVFHHKDDRIKSHVLLCMLAYYLMWHLNQKLAPLIKSPSNTGKNRKYTFDSIMENLKGIRKQTLEICGIKSTATSSPNDMQNILLDLLGINIPS